MPNTRRPTQDQPQSMAFPGIDVGVMENAAEAYKAWLKCMMTFNTEAGKFLTKRLQRDVQLPLSIVECHSPQEVMQAQIEFFNTMANDYSNQANRMGSIVSESFHSIDRPPMLAWPQPESAASEDRREAA